MYPSFTEAYWWSIRNLFLTSLLNKLTTQIAYLPREKEEHNLIKKYKLIKFQLK